MQATSSRWKDITRSAFPWEPEALAFVRDRLPDHEPYQPWSTFEFISEHGSVHSATGQWLDDYFGQLLDVDSRMLGLTLDDLRRWAHCAPTRRSPRTPGSRRS